MAIAQKTVDSDHEFVDHNPINHHDLHQHFSDDKAEFKRDMQNLVELLSKLNPFAEEFFPSSYADHRSHSDDAVETKKDSDANFSVTFRKRRNNYNPLSRRLNGIAPIAQREDCIRRTVYVSDIDRQVTEEQLADLFNTCGEVCHSHGFHVITRQYNKVDKIENKKSTHEYPNDGENLVEKMPKNVLDCRICGDPHSVLRFAFVEFADEKSAKAALNLAGTMLGYYPVRVLPSKTAILPVNPTFLPKSEDERETCARTVYCTNIDKKVSQSDIRIFFELYCGKVSRLRLLGDHVHSTRIAFVEFVMAQSAMNALNCSGVILGSRPVRVSPSKTPVRPRVACTSMHYQ